MVNLPGCHRSIDSKDCCVWKANGEWQLFKQAGRSGITIQRLGSNLRVDLLQPHQRKTFIRCNLFSTLPTLKRTTMLFSQDFSDDFILLYLRKFQVFSGCFLHRLTNQRRIPCASRAAHVQWTGFPGKTLIFYNLSSWQGLCGESTR